MSEKGLASAQFVLAAGLGLLLFLLLANVVIVQYGRGAVRSALDQGVRAASVSGSVGDCESRIHQVLGQLLGGAMGAQVVVSCSVGTDLVTARGSAVFAAWTPLTGDYEIDLTATATREVPP